MLGEIIREEAIGCAYISAIDTLDRNDLWTKRYDSSQASVALTKHEFNLFGLSSVKIDPPASGDGKVSYGTPVFDSETQEWEVTITFDVPAPVEMNDFNESVLEIYFTDIDRLMFDEDNYSALPLLYFEYDLPVGGNSSNVSLENATVYKVYTISQSNVRPKSMWEEELNFSDIMELELYTGELFPDVLFVNGSEYDPFTNRDRVFGSVTAWQVNGTINQTTVYDKIVLKLTYTAPIGVEETHVVDGNDLTVYATIVSTDGETHSVNPVLRIETGGGMLYEEIAAEGLEIGETPQAVTFEVSDIELPKYVGRAMVTEEEKLVAETSFTVAPSRIVLNEVYPYPNATQGAKEEWIELYNACLLYTSPSPRDRTRSRMPSSA